MPNHFGVRFAFELAAFSHQFVAERLEILDDAIVYQRDRSNDMRMGIAHCGRAMCRPARVGNARAPVKRMGSKLSSEVLELALCASPNQLTILDRADPGRVIAAIFEALQPIEQALGNITFPDNSDNSAHGSKVLEERRRRRTGRPFGING